MYFQITINIIVLLYNCYRIPFPCNCINFLDESKGLLLLGASDVDTIVLVNWKIGRLNVMNNQISSQVLEFSIKVSYSQYHLILVLLYLYEYIIVGEIS